MKDYYVDRMDALYKLSTLFRIIEQQQEIFYHPSYLHLFLLSVGCVLPIQLIKY